jgi:hypothetical protein
LTPQPAQQQLIRALILHWLILNGPTSENHIRGRLAGAHGKPQKAGLIAMAGAAVLVERRRESSRLERARLLPGKLTRPAHEICCGLGRRVESVGPASLMVLGDQEWSAEFVGKCA